MANVKKGHKIGIFALAMINIAIVFSLQTLPELAEYGYNIIAYVILACICFFIPAALVTTELASGWHQKGGVFLWVTKAFGPKCGFIAIFMQWTKNLVLFPVILAFMAEAIAYIINPSLATNKLFVAAAIWIALWAATFLNFHSMKLSAFFSSSGAFLGKITSSAVLIALGVIHIILEKPTVIKLSFEALIPQLHSLNKMMLLVGILMAFSGIEMSSVHVTEVKNPKKNFPKAIFISCVVVVFILVASPLSIALVVPTKIIILSEGVMQALEVLFNIHEKKWGIPVIAPLLAYGAFTAVVALMAAPSKAISQTARMGYLPKFMQIENKHGMPIGTLVIQALISSILSFVVLIMPSVSSAFWIMTALAAQLYFIMYLLMFSAAIKLRYSHPNIERPYKIPGGKIGIWLVSGIAFLTLVCAIILGFIPTETIRKEGAIAIISYIAFLFSGIVLFVGTSIMLHKRVEKIKGR